MSVLLKVVALVLFVVAGIIALGHASVDWSPSFIPFGLACWVASELVAGGWPRVVR